MPSLFLGRLCRNGHHYEVHAFTNGLGFRYHPSSIVSDAALFSELMRQRFTVLAEGRPIYCTAVRPDLEHQCEINPHDER